jgi:hypothetical protein
MLSNWALVAWLLSIASELRGFVFLLTSYVGAPQVGKVLVHRFV